MRHYFCLTINETALKNKTRKKLPTLFQLESNKDAERIRYLNLGGVLIQCTQRHSSDRKAVLEAINERNEN